MRKPPASPQPQDTIAPPHPLAERLIDRMQPSNRRRILDFACGSGRNGVALRRAGFSVESIADRDAVSDVPFAPIGAPFSAAISTHGLLHGTPQAIEARLRSIAGALENDGLLYATFGSSRDRRCGQGERIDASTFAPVAGDERGVPHAFFDRAALAAVLERHFVIESLEEHGADDVAGVWAHRERPLTGAVHWFATARKRSR